MAQLLNIEIPYDPEIPPLSILLRELKHVKKEYYTEMFITMLFIVANEQRWLKSPLTDKQNVVCTYNWILEKQL